VFLGWGAQQYCFMVAAARCCGQAGAGCQVDRRGAELLFQV
jgi:hypothetical protein